MVFAAALALAGSIAAACTGDSTPAPSATPTATEIADQHETRWPIKHVVFIIKENRSFDHFFGKFPGADGVTKGKMKVFFQEIADEYGVEVGDVVTRRLEPPPGQRYPSDLPHDYVQWELDYNDGKMDGFGVNLNAVEYAYTQMRPKDIPNYWSWAEDYVLYDNFFASAVGPSFPNHLMTIAASSAGTRDNPWQKL